MSSGKGFNKQDFSRNAFMLDGSFSRRGYDWWWHSFTATDEVTGESKPFFIEFFICNPSLGGEKAVLGQLKTNKENGVKPSYLMVKAGCWGNGKVQLHRFFALNDVRIKDGVPYEVEAGDCFASEFALRGSVEVSSEDSSNHPEYMCDSGSMSWDLKLDKKVAYNVGYGAGKLFRDVKAFEMYWHAQGMKTLYEGVVVLNGRRFIVTREGSYGYADKNWGRGFTSPWVWLSSNNLRSKLTGKKLEDSVFDIGGGRPKVFCFALNRQLLSAFWYEGKPYEFNFSKFWAGVKTEFSCEETDELIKWHVKQENRRNVMETDVVCRKADMLLVNYEEPDGQKRHNRLWNGGNGTGEVKLYEKTRDGLSLIDDIEALNIGCEYGEFGSGS